MNDVDEIALPGGEFELWPWACLRAAGFPASRALDLASTDAMAAADAVLAAEDAVAEHRRSAKVAIAAARATATTDASVRLAKAVKAIAKNAAPPETGTAADDALTRLREACEKRDAAVAFYEKTFGRERRRVFMAAQAIASDPRFREAVTWQNRAALESGVDRLLDADPAAIRSNDRRHEALVASQFFRYTTKNDTIGFFGPVGFARLDPKSPTITVAPGPGLLAHRRVYFEQWPIDALASLLTNDERFLVWQPPRRYGFLRIEDGVVQSPVHGRLSLSPASQEALLACDGARSALDIAKDLASTRRDLFADEAAVIATLRELREKKLVSWTYESTTTIRPELELRSRIAKIGDDGLRSEALRPLETLEAARSAVADAAGDAVRLGRALGDLDKTFTVLTGAAPTRNAGLMYAGRGLVFEDCRRDLDVVIGSRILEDIGPALSLVLASARWLTVAVADAYSAAFRSLYESLAKRAGSSVVSFADFYYRAQRLLHGTKDRPVDGPTAELRRRWSTVLRIDEGASRQTFDSAALRAAVAEAFPARGPGWQLAKHHSPDVMICASSPEAIARGEYVAVLGEIHASLNTLEASLWREHHPRPHDLDALLAGDLAEPRVLSVDSKDSTRTSSRGRRIGLPTDYEIETGFAVSDLPNERVLRLGELMLEDIDGALVVRARNGETRFDLLELMGEPLTLTTINAFDVLPELAHGPRVSIDRLVVRRERWTLSAAEIEFAKIDSELDRFLEARRWARSRGLPRQVFLKSSLEVKPVYLDFASPISIKLAAKIIRHAAEHVGGASLTLAEMLPTIEETWLPDAEGNRYACEVRFAAVDTARRNPT